MSYEGAAEDTREAVLAARTQYLTAVVAVAGDRVREAERRLVLAKVERDEAVKALEDVMRQVEA